MAIATVFGGTGFIGRYIVQRLARAGYTVRVPTRDLIKANDLCLSGTIGQIVPLPAPLAKAGVIEAAIEGADVVINLLGLLYENRRQTFQSLHIDLPARMAKAATAYGVRRFIHISALGADKTSPSRYARSKAMGEDGILKYFPTATILRPSVVFGDEDGFFNMLADLSAKAPFVPVFGGGTMKFQPVYVGDVADAVMAALSQPVSAGKTYELGGPRALSFKDAVRLTQKTTGTQRCIISLPWPVARMMAFFMELFPRPRLTADQLLLLRTDNVIHEGALTLHDLGLVPTAMEVVLPHQLLRYRNRMSA